MDMMRWSTGHRVDVLGAGFGYVSESLLGDSLIISSLSRTLDNFT